MKRIAKESIQRPERFPASVLTKEKIEAAIHFVLKQIDKNLSCFPDAFPAPCSRGGVYPPAGNEDWTPSFRTGMLWLAYEVTGDARYRAAAERDIKSFVNRLDKQICLNTHDIGFLYTLSCVAASKITGDKAARRTALSAADHLLDRYNEEAGVIQAWGNLEDPERQGCMIIDCLMNLPLLYWAGQATGNPKYTFAARRHAQNSMEYLVRPDASTFHTFYMDVVTGKPKFGKTRQGYSDSSSWSRGQAWSIYGFPLSYAYTGDRSFLDVAVKTANYFLNRLPKDGICCWDLIFTDEKVQRDSSAAAIAACGFLQLAKGIDLLDPCRKIYENAARFMVNSLIDGYLAEYGSSNGILLHGVYSIPENKGIDECCIWGDYFFFEALVRLSRDWSCYW